MAIKCIPNWRFGKPNNRVGIVLETWYQTPGTNHYVKALPKDTEWELVRIFGFYLGNYFIGIQRFVHKRDRKREGYKFGPDPNLLDLIKHSDED